MSVTGNSRRGETATWECPQTAKREGRVKGSFRVKPCNPHFFWERGEGREREYG